MNKNSSLDEVCRLTIEVIFRLVDMLTNEEIMELDSRGGDICNRDKGMHVDFFTDYWELVEVFYLPPI